MQGNPLIKPGWAVQTSGATSAQNEQAQPRLGLLYSGQKKFTTANLFLE